MYYSRDPQVLYLKKKNFKVGSHSTVLFTHLKIILLHYFQFLVFSKISNTQTHPKLLNLGKNLLSGKIFDYWMKWNIVWWS